MAGERLPARFSLRSQLWVRWTGKYSETATSHMQTVRHYYNETDNTHINNSDFNLWVSTETQEYEQLYGRN